jgi:hypothetical protein
VKEQLYLSAFREGKWYEVATVLILAFTFILEDVNHFPQNGILLLDKP